MWGGFCASVFANASGLVGLIATPLASADHRTASLYATLTAFLLLLFFVAGYVVSVYLLRWIDRDLTSPGPKIAAKALLPVVYLVLAVALIALTSVTVKASDKPASIIAAITAQDTQGTSEADFDLTGLKRLESHLVQTSVDRARRNFAQRGFDPRTFNPKVDSSSVFMTVGGKRLGVIKMNMDNGVRSVWVLGFRGDQFLRVTCVRGSDDEIPLFSGECGSKVTEAFGVTLTPQPKR